MEEVKSVALSKFEIEPSITDKFWEEKTKRAIQECNSIGDLKKMATLLLRIATQRQGVIRGLAKDVFTLNKMAIDQDDLANTLVPPSE